MGNGVGKQQSRDRPRKKNVHWKTAGSGGSLVSNLMLSVMCIENFPRLCGDDNKWSRYSSERPAQEIFIDMFHVSCSRVSATAQPLLPVLFYFNRIIVFGEDSTRDQSNRHVSLL